MGDLLPKNKELEAAMLCVDGRKFLARLDWVRKELPENSRAWEFLTKLAKKNPVKFMEYVDEFSNNLFEWDEIDAILQSGGPATNKIRAIKRYREILGSDVIGLTEAKRAVEERMRKLQV